MKAGRYAGLPGGFTPNDPHEWAAWMHTLTAEGFPLLLGLHLLGRR
jgi:hypothetical protein